MKTTLREAAGGVLVVGLAGTELSSMERAWLRLLQPAGVILFRRNIGDAVQTRGLLDEATGLCARNAFRCVDVEGGSVDRLRDALAPQPSALAVATATRQGQRKRAMYARDHGELIARGVKAFGFNTTLAPVLDLALPDSVAVMGTRAVAGDPAAVITYAREFLAGLAKHGVTGCGKHFPGLGGGMRDSHLETPAIGRSWEDLWSEDLEPYRALRRELPMVMVSHAAYPETRGKHVPASISPFWITTVLRERIGYRGLVFSDDLEMGGILKYLPIEGAVIEAIRAGTDTVEVCHSPEVILRAYEALIREGERSAAFGRMLLARAGEASRKRAKLFRGGPPAPLPARQLETLKTRIAQFRDEVARASSAPNTEAEQNSSRPVVETA